MEKTADQFLDITGLLCPMTFVRTKLGVERLKAGQILEVRLNFGEPLHNVPASLTEHGYAVLSVQPENPDTPEGPHRLLVKRG